MSYTTFNFKTKKALKEAVHELPSLSGALLQNQQHHLRLLPDFIAQNPANLNGDDFWIEGPHSPAPHTWYAQVRVKSGVVVAVLS